MPLGRPTDYNETVLNRTKKYLAYHKSAEMENALPSVASLALELHVARSTIYEWAKVHKDFSDILDDILSLQEHKLLSNGLMNRWNPTITKLALGKHGYKESQDVTSGDKPVAPILVRFLGDEDNRGTE